MSSTAGETAEEEQTSKEPTIDRDKEEDSIVSETTTESSRATVMPIENVPVSSVEPQHQQQQATSAEAEDKETVTESEAMEQVNLAEEQEEGGDDDEMVAISESAATSEVIVDDDVVDDEAEDMADEPEEETMEEEVVVEEEEEGEGEEEGDEDEEDVDIEGFETATTDQNMEGDVGMTKSDPIELSSDEDTEHIPPVMLSSTVRSVDLLHVCRLSVCMCVCLNVHLCLSICLCACVCLSVYSDF